MITANHELQLLIQLQELDLKIIELQEKTRQIPQELEKLDAALEVARREVSDTGLKTEEETRERRRLEGEVELLRQKLSKYKSQLMEVKTNKEYQAVLHEIGTVEEEIRSTEDKILDRMVSIEESEARVRVTRKKLEEEETQHRQKRRELESFAAQFDEAIAKLQSEREQLLKEISNGLVRQYQRIASARKGVALAEARDQSCQACHVKLRPQLFNDVKTNRFIIRCESCNRILYYPGN